MSRPVQVRLHLHGTLHQHARTPSKHVAVDVPDGTTLHGLFDHLAGELPALERAIRDETGSVRQHINVFVDGDHVRDRRSTRPLPADAEVLVLPAVSGG